MGLGDFGNRFGFFAFLDQPCSDLTGGSCGFEELRVAERGELLIDFWTDAWVKVDLVEFSTSVLNGVLEPLLQG